MTYGDCRGEKEARRGESLLGAREGAGEEAEKERRRGEGRGHRRSSVLLRAPRERGRGQAEEPREREGDSVWEKPRAGVGGCTTCLQGWREREGYLWWIQRGREREDWAPPEGGEGDGGTADLHAGKRDPAATTRLNR